MSGLLGKKVGMTRLCAEDGTLIPVTLVSAEPNVVTQVKTAEKDGYNAIALGFGRRTADITKATGNLKNKFLFVREIRVDDPTKYTRNQEVNVGVLEGATEVSIRGTSKGKGFSSVVKRHHFKCGPRSHGSKYSRGPGSSGTRKPRRTKRGKRLSGHMGVDTVTLHHIPVVSIDKEHNIVALKGPLPGSINSLVMLWIPVNTNGVHSGNEKANV